MEPGIFIFSLISFAQDRLLRDFPNDSSESSTETCREEGRCGRYTASGSRRHDILGMADSCYAHELFMGPVRHGLLCYYACAVI